MESKSAARQKPAVRVGIVDIFEPVGETDGSPPRQAGERVGERMRARPPDSVEQRRQMPRVAGADQPEAAVLGRAEGEVMASEQAEGRPDVTHGESRDVGANEHRRARRAGAERAAHAHPEIAAALTDSRDRRVPELCAMSGHVGRDSEAQAPAPVRREAAQQSRDHDALEAQCRDRANLPRQPALPGAELRRANEQHEGALHQP